MFKIFKKALSVTLSVTLLMSTILVGGMFSFSASAATDLSGTEMPLTYTFDFEEGTFADYTYQGAGEAYTDADGNSVVEHLYGSSVDQFGNTFYPLRTRANDKASAVYRTLSVTTVNGATENRGVVTLDNTAQSLVSTQYGEHLMYIPTDRNGKPYIIEPNTNYKVTIKAFIESGDGQASVYVGGGAIRANSPKYIMGDSYRTYAGTAGAISSSSGAGFLPIYRAHDPNVAATHPFHAPLSSAADGGGYDWKLGNASVSGGFGAHWSAIATTAFNEAANSTDSYKCFTLPMTTGDFTLNENGQFVLQATGSGDGATFSPYFAIAMTKNKMLIHFDSITIEKEASVTLDANGGYFGEFDAVNPTTTSTVSGFVGAALSATPSHPDASTTFVGWSLDGVNVIDASTFSNAIAGRTLKAVWAEEDNTYTFDFDTVKDFGLLTYNVPGNAASVDQYGQTFYPFVSYNGATMSAGGNTVQYNDQTVTTLRLSGINHGMMRYIPTDADGLPYIVKPNTKYKVDVTYYAENWYASDNLYFGAGASLAYSNNIKQGNWCWLTSAANTIVRYYPDGTSETGDLPGFDEWGYHPQSIGMVGRYSNGAGMGVAYSDQDQTNSAPVNFKTESVYFTTSNFTPAADGSYTWTWGDGSNWKTAPYFCFSYGQSYGKAPASFPRDFQIDKIVITEVQDDVTVNFDANGGILDSTSATLTPGDAIEVTPTHSDASYHFVGWSWYKNTYVPANVATSGMNGATLYAYWDQMIPVTFNANGGAINGKDAVTNNYNDGDTITAPTPERRRYTFKGWAESANSNVIVNLPANATFDIAGKTYYAVWEPALHGDYDTFTRVVDYSSFVSGCVSDIGSNACNTWVANDNYNYTWQSVGTDPEVGSSDGYYLHYKAPQVINSVEYVPAGWAPHYSLIMTESGTHTNSGDMTDPTNLYLPENTTYRVTLRMKTVVLEAGSLNLRVGYGSNYAHSSFTNILTGIGEMEDWTNVTAVFTTPASYTKGSEKCILNLIPAKTSTKLEYMIDSITLEKVTATTLYTVDKGVATEANTVYGVPGTDLVLPTEVSTENYFANGTATVSRTPIANWYADSALAAPAVTKFANINTAIYGSVEGDPTTTSAINQDLYCGFDTYTLNGGAATFITDEEAYTGNFSAKANKLTDIEVRNTNDLAIKAGKTYKISFSYKSFGDAAITVGLARGASFIEEKAIGLALSNEWTNASAVFTADKGIEDGYKLVLRAKGVYIDNVVVSSIADSVGVVTEDGTNLRFLMTYNLTGDKIMIEGEEFTITKRGILVKGEESAKDILDFAKTENFADCWNYDEVTGKLIFSANINVDNSFGSNKIVARGYVTLSDGTTYYTDYVTVSLDDVVSADDVVADAVANDYYVYLPEGTVLAAEAASAATFYNLFVSGEVVVNDVLDNNTMKFGAYAKFSSVPAVGAITVPDEAKYLVHAGAYEDLCAGVDAHVATYKLDQVGENAINYIFITDLHFDANNTEVTKQMQLITNMANNDDSIDMVVVGGDITTGMFTTKEAAITATQNAIAPLKNCTKPVIVLRGNHDDNTYLSENDLTVLASRTVSDLDWENNINRFVNDESVCSKFVHNSAVPNSAYFYYDIVKNGKTTRVIALNACDQDLTYDENGNVTILPVSVRSWETENGLLKEGRNVTIGAGVQMYGYSSRQMKWLAEEALAGFDGDIIVLSHMATDGHGQDHPDVSPVKNSEALTQILNAYQTKGSYSGTLYDELADVYNLETREYTARAGVAVSADFSATDGKILIYQYGHTHIEMITYYANANFWEINTATANYFNAPKNYDNALNSMNQNYPWNIATKAERTENSDTACFDVVSAGSNVVYKFNVGFGEDATMVVSR